MTAPATWMTPGSRRTTVALGALLAAALLGACSGSGSSTGSASGTTSQAASNGSATTSGQGQGGGLSVATTSLGRVVAGPDGRTAYYFTKDEPNSGKSACSGPCTTAWPAITAPSEQPSATGVNGTLGTIRLPDGRFQVTLQGRPLYYFAKDRAPGDVTGQGVNDVWYVVSPDGAMVTDAPSTPAASGY